MGRVRVFLAALTMVGGLGWASPAHAASIIYTTTSIATGSLGGTPFTDAAVTVTLTADTSGVTEFDPVLIPGFLINAGVASVSIDGLGSATFNSANGYTAGFAPSGLFGALPILAILEFDNPSQTSFTGISGAFHALLAGNDLRNAFGPAIGTGLGIATNPNGTPVSYSTTAGALILTAGNDPTTLTVTVDSVPEPAALSLFALGAIGAIAVRRLRQRHTY